ncbi:MAG: EAL domain-containing protein [Pseudomonadota bacterium]
MTLPAMAQQKPGTPLPAARVALAFFGLASLWSLAADRILALLIGAALPGGGLHLFMNLVFAAGGGGLLYVLLTRFPVGGERRAMAIPQPRPWSPLATFILFALGLIGTGFYIFDHQRDHLRADSEAQLKTVGELRIEQISQWLRIAQANARQFGEGSQLTEHFAAWLASGRRDASRAERLLARMDILKTVHGYSHMVAFDQAGKPSLGDLPDAWMLEHTQEALKAMATGHIQLVDFHQHGQGKTEPMVGMMAPMTLGQGAERRMVGALLFSLSARDSLFALLRRWPTPSASGETVLIRREGDQVRHLFASLDPPSRNLGPMLAVHAQSPAFRAFQGESGILSSGRDFRGEPVLAYASPVPHTPWILVAKQRAAEVDAPVLRLASSTALATGLLLAASGLAFWLWWRNLAHRQQAQLLGKELERRVLERHFDFLSRYANEAILLLDLSGLILEMNDRVQDMYGYAREELQGQALSLVHPPDGLVALDALLGRILAEGQLRVETEQRHRDGHRFPVEISARRFQVEGVERLHVIIRDISERRRDEEQLRMQALVLDQIQDKVTITDLAGVITYVNKVGHQPLDRPEEEFIGHHVSAYGDEPESDASQAEIIRATLERGGWKGKVINLTARGDKRVINLRTSLIRDGAGQPRFMVGLGTDITDQVRAEQALLDREARYRAVIETSADGFWVLDQAGRLLEVNEAYCRRSGYSREELLAMSLSALEAQESATTMAARREQAKAAGSVLFETVHRARDGSLWRVEVNASFAPIEGGLFFVFLRDVGKRNRADALLRTRLRLSDLALSAGVDELMQGGLDAAEQFTGSTIGFFHFVEPDQETLALQAWSANTLRHMCTMAGKGLHYPVSQAGVWADSVRERRVLIHNDYPNLANRKGLPEGHAPVLRELVVPILRGDRVVAVLGVGNKSSDYDGDDVEVVSQIATLVMDVVERKRAEEALTMTNARLLEAQRMARMGYWEYDVVADRVTWSEGVYDMLGLDPALPPPNFAGHRTILHPDDFPLFEADVQGAIQRGLPYQHEVRILRPDGAVRHLWHTGQAERDGQGHVLRLRGTVQDISEQRQAEARLEQATHFDVLTRLPNARLMLEKTASALQAGGQEGSSIALLLLNLDRFAQLNETLGRSAGDLVLAEVARRWRECLPEGCQLGRLDSDRFLVLAPGMHDDREIKAVADTLTAALRQPITVDKGGRSATLTASIGIALYPADARDAAALLHAAEDAMRGAKAERGGQARFYDREHARAAVDWFETETALRLALERDEFILLYQAQIDVMHGRAVAAEALIRWRRDGRMIPPAQFIQVVEGTDLAEPVSRWVLRQACRQARIWLDRQHPMRVAVNIFSDHVTSGHLLDDVTAALEESALPPELLELEVLESSLLKNPEAAARHLRDIKRKGVRLALDDFGTGYSSLGYLKHYPFDVLKIDQIFTRNVTRDPEDAAIVRSTISLAHNLGMRVLAEGVETEPQLRFMARYGCDQVQGYLLGRPANPEDVETLVMERRDLRPRRDPREAISRNVLVVEDEALEAERLAMILEDAGYRVFVAEDLPGVLDVMGRERIDLIMADHYLAQTTGVEILTRMLQLFPDVPRVMASASTDHRVVMEAVNQAGIRAFLIKPVLPDTLLATLRGILQEERHG